ncbi:GtrA family protein [Pseudomonas arsenicoxydans]|uniref:Bactoprenol-linked glucose translocase n=1 Tax=Pseudomonas arsenicoxydans TaxID=702115 RepID=A0A4P6G8G4_9PSED|nr:GtrA family protein [Pseudomonas arsenicoxydans]QAY87915.1 sugar translocase [Pseudomonas arsenicoxydans]
MKALWKEFSTFAVVGVASSLIHWQLFYVLVSAAQLSQAVSNFSAFCVAATFSFYVHALYTFEAGASALRYLVYVFFMGVMSFVVGHYADVWKIHGLVTVASFSLLSLICGMFFSRLIMFKEREE